jgi:hypothetical protein
MSPNWDYLKDNKKLTILRDLSFSKMGSKASDLSVTVVISSVIFFTPYNKQIIQQ